MSGGEPFGASLSQAKNPMMKKILVICLPGIGDTLNATPIFRPLARRFPDAIITALVMYKPCMEVLETNPYIHEVILWEFLRRGPAASLKFLLKLRRRRFDMSITCFPANRREYNLVSFVVGARLRLAHQYLHQNVQNLFFLNNRTILETPGLHNVEENLRLLELGGVSIEQGDKALSLPLEAADNAFASEFLKSIRPDSLLIGMHAWSTTLKNMHKKCWSADNFAILAHRLKEEYDCEILLFQGPHDSDVNRQIVAKCPHPLQVVENTSVRQSAAIMRRCHLFITNDSGPMHIAAAAGTKIIAIFGPTNPKELHPWTAEYSIVRTGIECSPCFYYSPMPLVCVRKDFACLTQLSVDSVYSEVKRALIGASPREGSNV